MNIPSKITAAILCAGACAGAASSAGAADFDDYAKVLRVSPQTEQVNRPRQECRTEYVQVERQQSRGAGGSILGGVAGAIIGNQVGKGNGRTAATAAGAIAGAVVGDRMENNDRVTTVGEQPVRQCYTVDHWETQNTGYAVTYEYRGHSYTSVMPYDPGDRLKVQVSVMPRI